MTSIPNARERLINAAIEILGEEPDTARITVRRIAERAGVGVGLLNYHFKTKEALLNDAVSGIMMKEVMNSTPQGIQGEVDPLDRLITLLKATSEIAIKYPSLTKVAASYELLQGAFKTESTIIPLLEGIFGKGLSEIDLRIKAFQIVAPLQLIFIRSEAFADYCGIDISDQDQRNRLVESFVRNIVGNRGKVGSSSK